MQKCIVAAPEKASSRLVVHSAVKERKHRKELTDAIYQIHRYFVPFVRNPGIIKFLRSHDHP